MQQILARLRSSLDDDGVRLQRFADCVITGRFANVFYRRQPHDITTGRRRLTIVCADRSVLPGTFPSRAHNGGGGR